MGPGIVFRSGGDSCHRVLATVGARSRNILDSNKGRVTWLLDGLVSLFERVH